MRFARIALPSLTMVTALACAFPIRAEDGDTIPPDAMEIDVRDDVTIDFRQIDVMVMGDPVDQVAGATDQFTERMILGTVFLKKPIYRSELAAIARAKGSTAMSFRCDRGGLYQVEGTDIVGGERCELVRD